MVDIDDLSDDARKFDSGKEGEQVYNAEDLEPGGRGKQGDQQEMGQARESRRDKSHNQAGTDKLHGA